MKNECMYCGVFQIISRSGQWLCLGTYPWPGLCVIRKNLAYSIPWFLSSMKNEATSSSMPKGSTVTSVWHPLRTEDLQKSHQKVRGHASVVEIFCKRNSWFNCCDLKNVECTRAVYFVFLLQNYSATLEDKLVNIN